MFSTVITMQANLKNVHVCCVNVNEQCIDDGELVIITSRGRSIAR